MMYDTNDDPAEHDCAWFEEEVQRLRSELESARAVVRALADLGDHGLDCDDRNGWCSWDGKKCQCGMKEARDALHTHLASFPVESGS